MGEIGGNCAGTERKESVVLRNVVDARIAWEKACYAFADAQNARTQAAVNLEKAMAQAGEVMRSLQTDPTEPQCAPPTSPSQYLGETNLKRSNY